MAMLKEFNEFLKEYKIVPLAVAFIIGIAATSLIQSIVNNLIMPIVTFFIPGGAWRNAAVAIGPIILPWGALLNALVYFIIIAFVVFMIAKHFFKEEKVMKK